MLLTLVNLKDTHRVEILDLENDAYFVNLIGVENRFYRLIPRDKNDLITYLEGGMKMEDLMRKSDISVVEIIENEITRVISEYGKPDYDFYGYKFFNSCFLVISALNRYLKDLSKRVNGYYPLKYNLVLTEDKTIHWKIQKRQKKNEESQ